MLIPAGKTFDILLHTRWLISADVCFPFFVTYYCNIPETSNIKILSQNISLGRNLLTRELNRLSDDIDLTWVNDNASTMKLGIKLTPGLEQYFCDIHTIELANSWGNTQEHWGYDKCPQEN